MCGSHARALEVAVPLVRCGAKGEMEEDGDQGHLEAENERGNTDGEVAVGEFRGGFKVAARVEESEESLDARLVKHLVV